MRVKVGENGDMTAVMSRYERESAIFMVGQRYEKTRVLKAPVHMARCKVCQAYMDKIHDEANVEQVRRLAATTMEFQPRQIVIEEDPYFIEVPEDEPTGFALVK